MLSRGLGWSAALWAAQLPLATFFLYRLLAPDRPGDRLPAWPPAVPTRAGWAHVAGIAGRAVVAAAVVALAIATFRS